MWIQIHSVVAKDIRVEDIWNAWIDVNSWTEWHSGLEYCKLSDDFAVGNYFLLKPKGAREVKIQLTEVEKNKSFTDCTTFFGAKMFDTHIIEKKKSGSILLTNKIVVEGPLTWLWVKLVAQNVANSTPNDLESLIDFIKSNTNCEK